MNKLLLLAILISGVSQAQFFEEAKPTKIDTLKGSNTEFRNFWDVKKIGRAHV